MKLIETTSATVTMTSLEIAELTGKEHKEVLRDIRKTLSEAEIDAAKNLAPWIRPKQFCCRLFRWK